MYINENNISVLLITKNVLFAREYNCETFPEKLTNFIVINYSLKIKFFCKVFFLKIFLLTENKMITLY